jgi:hypothetical protein
MAFDRKNGGSFIVTTPDGNVNEFIKQSAGGLYFLDTTAETAIVMVNTVANNKGHSTNDDKSHSDFPKAYHDGMARLVIINALIYTHF